MPDIECGVSRRGMAELIEGFSSDNWDRVLVRIREGRGTGVLFEAAWMLNQVSPRLSGNYHVFSGVGNYPRRCSPPTNESRKGLRTRINRAIMAGVMEFREPEYEDRVDAEAGDPPNAAPKPTERLDIPLIALQPDSYAPDRDRVLIPTSWRSKEYRSQIHPTDTYRLDNVNDTQITALIALGELILDRHQSLQEKLQQETSACWVNLKGYLEKQHHDTKKIYESNIERVEKALQGQLKRTAIGLYLASCLIRLWPHSWVITCTEAIKELEHSLLHNPAARPRGQMVRFRNRAWSSFETSNI